jgi:hypothetical protein
MDRDVRIWLNDVAPIPTSLRSDPQIDSAADRVAINLTSLFQHYYFDSYPAAPPHPDPSRFEYLDLVSDGPDFCLLDHVRYASLVKRRAMSTELGQAFCRLMLEEHFGVVNFAHMNDVLGKQSHPAFNGIAVRRIAQGDVPDYLCAGRHGRPCLAEAKGRFTSISFSSREFQRWRDQFSRIAVLDRTGRARSTKGFIVATRLRTVSATSPADVFIEDPATRGEGELGDNDWRTVGRGVAALHYARVFRKLDLLPHASALSVGYALTRQLTLSTTIWTCLTPPFEHQEFVGGFYRTVDGHLPRLTESGWQVSPELGRGHAVFVGLQRETAESVAAAARGNWNSLIEPPVRAPEGVQSSDFGSLRDGTVMAPLEFFVPTGQITL